jgi:hypothetical protein
MATFTSTTWQWTWTHTPTGGQFKLLAGGDYRTSALDWNADAATIQAALEGLSSIGSGNVSVANTSGDIWQATFAFPVSFGVITSGTSPLQYGSAVSFQDGSLAHAYEFDHGGIWDVSGQDNDLNPDSGVFGFEDATSLGIANNNFNYLTLSSMGYASAPTPFPYSFGTKFPLSLCIAKEWTSDDITGTNILSFGFYGSGSTHKYMFLNTIGGVLRFSDGADYAAYADLWTITTGWHMVVIVCPDSDPANMICYVDGTAQTLIASSGTLDYLAGTLYLYANPAASNYDCVRLWESALTTDQILDQPNNQQGVLITNVFDTGSYETGSGGCTIGGTGLVVVNQVGSGGTTIGGTGTVHEATAVIGSGGLVIGGTGSVAALTNTSNTGSGGCLLGGTGTVESVVPSDFHFTGSGGVVVGSNLKKFTIGSVSATAVGVPILIFMNGSSVRWYQNGLDIPADYRGNDIWCVSCNLGPSKSTIKAEVLA